MATVRIWKGDVLVEYVDKNGVESSFVVKTEKDLKELKKELENSK